PPRRPPPGVRPAGRRDHGPIFAEPKGKRRPPARLVPELGQYPAALPAMAGVLPKVPAAGADRLGQERPDLPGRRGGALQARPQDSGVPPARRRALRAGKRWGPDRSAHARLPRPARRREGPKPKTGEMIE